MTYSLRERLDALKKKNENGLLPCPICGDEAQAEYASRPKESLLNAPWQVRCFRCGTRGSRRVNQKYAEHAWNTRPCEAALIAICQDELRELERLMDGYRKIVQICMRENIWDDAAQNCQCANSEIEEIATQALKEAGE